MKVLTCTFDHNFAKTGGAIHNEFGTMEIQACVFDRNHAKLDGGALWNYRGTIKIQSCAFDNHHAGQDGGAVVLFKGTMEMHGCNITNCSAEVLPLPRSATSLREHTSAEPESARVHRDGEAQSPSAVNPA